MRSALQLAAKIIGLLAILVMPLLPAGMEVAEAISEQICSKDA